MDTTTVSKLSMWRWCVGLVTVGADRIGAGGRRRGRGHGRGQKAVRAMAMGGRRDGHWMRAGVSMAVQLRGRTNRFSPHRCTHRTPFSVIALDVWPFSEAIYAAGRYALFEANITVRCDKQLCYARSMRDGYRIPEEDTHPAGMTAIGGLPQFNEQGMALDGAVRRCRVACAL